jgi:hypothetical protein
MITEAQKSYFRNPAHKAVEGFYFASNGAAFFRECDAEQQAANLKKQGKSEAVHYITRTDYEAQLALEAEAGSTDPQVLQAQSDMDAAEAAVKTAEGKLNADAADEEVARKALEAARATGDAAAMTQAQQALDAVLARASRDAVDRKKAQESADAAKTVASAKKQARNGARKNVA